jgi:hypothetical protein
MTVPLSRVTSRQRRGRASHLDTNGSAARTSQVWAAANASSAIDGGVVLPMRSPTPIMSTGKGPQTSRPAKTAAPPAARAQGRHRARVRVPSRHANPASVESVT